MAEGRCNCGAVRFAIDMDLQDVYVCHCSICRRFTGANGIAVLIVPNDKFRLVMGRGDVVTWKKSDGDWQCTFCRHCGSAMPGENSATSMYVPAGSLSAGGETLRVVHHVWVGSSACWDVIGDSGEQHVEGLKRCS